MTGKTGEKMIWTNERIVSPHDLDINNIASPSAYLRLMQEAAYDQMQNFPPTMDDLRKENKVFVLSRMSMSIYGELHACDKVTVSTWACEGKGVMFPRCARIEKDGQMVAELTSVWALIDPESRKLWRTSDYYQSYGFHEQTELALPLRVRISPDTGLSLEGEYQVLYNDCDLNRHVNNTHYPDILCSFLPGMEKKKVVDMAINYISEAPIGKSLKIYVSREDDGVFFIRSVNEDGSVNVEAEVILDDIR